ncbi:MAG: drug/metabolite transporter (DMT)-like permease [Motiliproteus sp.]|jgi:drug/metabolite transporter (DMT)-like permease
MRGYFSTPAVQGVLFGLLAAAIWSGHNPVSALGIRAGLAATDLAALRILVASLLFLPYLLARRRNLLGSLTLPQALLLACCAGAPFSLIQIAGLHFAPMSHAAAISLGAVPLFATLLGLLFLGSRLTPRRLVAVASLLAGILLIVEAKTGRDSQAWLGDLCFAVAAFLWALYAFLGHRWRVPPLLGVALSSLLSLPYLLVYGLLLEPRLNQIASQDLALQVFYQGGMIGVLAIYSYSRAISLLGLEKGVLFTAMAPIGVMLNGIWILGYHPNEQEWLGIMLVTCGILMTLLIPRSDVLAKKPFTTAKHKS